MKNGNDPYAQLDPVPLIRMTAAFQDGGELPLAQVSKAQGGQELSPALEWERVPNAKSYLLTCYDPDAPTMSGFWHWVVADIPASVTSTTEGEVPEGATVRLNEALERGFIGAAPPAGHGPHRYFFTVQALDVERLDVPDDLTAARVHFMAREHVIARGHLHATWANPDQCA
ncbi:hypothetical protein USB125703_01623 [Pseudoclavibacter triregionum]|nr:hypothetical protein USB125703_01623 [Pseudoclavibacter triregionum]